MGVCCGRQAEVEGFEPDVMRVESASDLSNVLDDAARLYGGVFQWCALIRVSDGQVLHREEHGGAKGNDARNGEEGMMTFMAFVASAVKPTHGGGRAATSVHVKDDTLLTAVHILGTVALITVISFEQDPASLAALDATEVAKTVHQLLAPVVESHLSSCRHEADPEVPVPPDKMTDLRTAG